MFDETSTAVRSLARGLSAQKKKMMKINETIGNKETGETLTLMIMEPGICKYKIFLPPFRPSPPLHYHIDFTETFTVVEGELDFYVGKEEKLVKLTAGQSATAGLNELHRFANDHPAPVTFTVEAKPAGGIVNAFQLAYGVANDGGADEVGLPRNKLTRLYFVWLSGGYLANVPLFLQKAAMRSAIFLLSLTGRRAKLDKYLQ
jgi:mannose-6-phosphate isomerase-like protein (cupin superfamily)